MHHSTVFHILLQGFRVGMNNLPHGAEGARQRYSSHALSKSSAFGRIGVEGMDHVSQPYRARVADTGDAAALSFFTKLYDVLSNPDAAPYIAWREDGSAFVVLDPDGFAEHIMPRTLQLNNIRSFTHQLDTHGFTRSAEHVAAERLEFSRTTSNRMCPSHQHITAPP